MPAEIITLTDATFDETVAELDEARCSSTSGPSGADRAR